MADVQIQTESPYKRALRSLMLASCHVCHGEGKVGNRHDTKFNGVITPNVYQTECSWCKGTGFHEKGRTQ